MRAIWKREIRAEFNDQELNVNTPRQLLEAFKKSRDRTQVDGRGVPHSNQASLRRQSSRIPARAKKLSSSVESLLADVRNGRLHSNFNPLGAIHGRFSSSDPNLQNVHRGELRECFIPSKVENVLISADYSPDRASRRGSHCPGRRDDRGSQAGRGSPPKSPP